MIASLQGEVTVRHHDQVVIRAAGVGYRLTVSAQTMRQVPPLGLEFEILCEMVVRDDSISLYGFAAEDERELFGLLTAVSGIGPKVAIATLSSGPAGELARAIALGDAKRFQAVAGIGKRTSERIIVELREKVAERLGIDSSGGGLGGLGGEAVGPGGEVAGPRGLARDGLLGLGYSPAEVERLLAAAVGESAEALISSALQSTRTGGG